MNEQQQLEKARNYFIELVRALYKIGDGRDGSEEWRLHQARVRGFQEAARLLEIFTYEEVQQIIDATHLEIMGETRQERRARLDGVDEKLEQGDWDAFDAPAYERYRSNPEA